MFHQGQTTHWNDFRHDTQEMKQQLVEACEEIDSLKVKASKIDKLESEVKLLKKQNFELQSRMQKQESYSRRENVIIHGFDVGPEDNPQQIVQDLFQKLGVGPFQLLRCHRLNYGKKPIIARFVSFQDKLEVLKKRKSLKGSNIFINDDLAPGIAKRQAELLPILKYIKQTDPDAKVNIYQDKLRYNGAVFTNSNIGDLPIDLFKVGTKSNDTHVFFSGEYSVYSNLYPCNLLIDGQLYNSSEQNYQYNKCTALKMPDVAARVLECATPREAMRVGKSVKAPEAWAMGEGEKIMCIGLRAKLNQVHRFKKALEDNSGKLLVEATRDPVWGIVLQIAVKEIGNSKLWTGKNLLGKILSKMINTKSN